MEELRIGDGRFLICCLQEEEITFELCCETIKIDKTLLNYTLTYT